MIVPGQIDVLTSSTFGLHRVFRTFALFPCQESRMMVPPCHILPYHPLRSYSFMPEQHVRQKLQFCFSLYHAAFIHALIFFQRVGKWIPRETKWINTFFYSTDSYDIPSSSRYLEWYSPWDWREGSRILKDLSLDNLVVWAFLWPPRCNKKGNSGIQEKNIMRNLCTKTTVWINIQHFGPSPFSSLDKLILKTCGLKFDLQKK